MDGIAHLLGIGRIIGNLHTPEVSLRFFLCRDSGQKSEIPGKDVSSVPETPMTDYRALGNLIKSYNDTLKPEEHQYRVDPDVVCIRDALAHGRLMAVAPSFPLTLWKFGKAKDGNVPVEFCVQLDEVWLEYGRKKVSSQIENIHAHAKLRWKDWAC